MADLIKSGRRCHATGKYKRALTFFTKAMRSCPCSSGTKLDKCTCRNFEKIASQGGSIFKEAVEICPCNVGILLKRCDDPHHIQALDFRAASYEALGKLNQAIKDAEWILELAPRLPDGYLCLGRIARQQKKDEYAWKIYTAGIEAMHDSAVDSSPKLEFILCDAFPRLEQLKIGPNLPYLGPEPMAVSPKRWERLWPFLTVLRFDTWTFGDGPEADRLAEMTRSTLRYLTCLNRGNSLEHIQFNFPHQNGRCFSSDDHDLLPDFDVTEHSEYRNLKSFNLRTVCMPPDRVRTLLCNAIETKKLTSFDIVFPQGPPTAGERVGDESIRHLQGYEWFRGTPTIHTLGCYDFRFRPDAENDENLPLPQFLASFPNLRTLSVHSEHYNKLEFASVVVAIIKRTHLKTIYTPSVDCEVLGQRLRQVARDHGVELIDADRPDEWPIKLSE
ncbi:uncharacterized protein CPUR_03488 [Claviceps purpurea 20.1]|uniref:Uncharacterized protein n=1 Tax=Claviceps purpurea (strain 20.1) TaxID=1111077 RepID=M1W0L1_CLAP2|nr:uncharacterized protein CPUR_03488 [Claviceps purpurea 20.1]